MKEILLGLFYFVWSVGWGVAGGLLSMFLRTTEKTEAVYTFERERPSGSPPTKRMKSTGDKG